MATYIVVPKTPELIDNEPILNIPLSEEKNRDWKNFITNTRKNDIYEKELRRWISKAEKSRTAKLISQSSGRSSYGIKIIDMSHNNKEKLLNDIEGLKIYIDKSITLGNNFKTLSNGSSQSSNLPRNWHLDAIGLLKAQKKGFNKTGDGVVIAVLDTGVSDVHSSLRGKILASYEVRVFSARFGTVNVVEDGNHDTFPKTHGTLVAGLISGDKVGVAPGSKIMSLITFPGGSGKFSNLAYAIKWLTDRDDVKILNISLGIKESDSVSLEVLLEMVKECRQMGKIIVSAVGNSGAGNSESPGNFEEVISVGATEHNNKVIEMSGGGIMNNGKYTTPDLVAPGKDVTSTDQRHSKYKPSDGTSLSSGIVAGVCALILEGNKDITIGDLESILYSSCKDLDVDPTRQGHGLIQIRPDLF